MGEIKKKKRGVHSQIEKAWEMGKIRIDSTVHARLRSEQRSISVLDLRDVVLYGSREEEFDTWKRDRAHWVYALRNKDVDGSDIRAIFDIEAYPDVVVVTLMHVYP